MKELQHLFQMLQVLRICDTEDQYIIKENKNKFLSLMASHDWFQITIHSKLKCVGATSETKGHDQEFIVAHMCLETSETKGHCRRQDN